MINDHLNHLSAEEKLLLSLCSFEFSEKQKTEIRDQMTGIKDWDFFVNLAYQHGITALVWHNLNETGNRNEIPLWLFGFLY